MDLDTLTREQLIATLRNLAAQGVDVAAAMPRAQGFAQDFRAAFTRLRQAARVNLVTLSSLRAALPQYDRGTFDRELYELRRANLFVMESYDGRHGKPSAAEIAAAIDEHGRRYIYVCQRNS